MNRRGWILAVVGAVVVAGVIALVAWSQQPHSAAAQYERALQSENALRERLGQLSPDEVIEVRDRLIEEFERVWTEFEDDGTHDDARLHVAELYEELGPDKARAAEACEALLAEHPDSDLAPEALRNLARLTTELGIAEPERAASLKWFNKAVDTLEQFVDDHPDAAWAEEATVEIARITQDHIQDPPIRAREALDRYLEVYTDTGKFADEVHFRLGKWYESVKAVDDAVREYTVVTKSFPHSKYVDPALERLEEIYAKKTDEQDKAADMARKLAERNKGTSKGQRYAIRAREHESQDLKRRDRQYEGEYYGAPIVDVTIDKPFAPEYMKELEAQQVDTTAYRLDVAIDPETGRLTVTGDMKMVNVADAPRTQLLLQFNGTMVLEGLTFNGAPVEVATPSKPGHEVVRLKFSKPWPAGAEGTLAFEASGKFDPPSDVPEGLDLELGHVPTPEQEAELLRSIEGDIRLRLGREGYAISAAAWYPLTLYGDVFTTDVTYRLPAPEFEVSATGAMTRPEGDGAVRRYVSAEPIFGIYFAYGPYETVETDWSDGRKIVAYVAPERKDFARELCLESARILRFYEDRFGKLNQPRLTITITPLPAVLGGIGPAGMMILARHYIGEDRVPQSLLAHELSHQWWGNQVPVSLKEGYSMWLSEGFASYCDALYSEHVHGREFLVQHLRKYGIFYFEGATSLRGGVHPVASCWPTHPLYRQTVYEKGALALHTLRYVLGDDATFFRILRRYATDFRGRTSTIEDFRQIVEQATGSDYRWFFDEWLRRADVPHYVIQGVEPVEGRENAVQVTILQDLPGTAAPWRTPVDVAFYGPGGEEKILRRQTVDERENVITAELPWSPVRVELDPEYWLFRHPGSENVWPRPEPPTLQPTGNAGPAGDTPAEAIESSEADGGDA